MQLLSSFLTLGAANPWIQDVPVERLMENPDTQRVIFFLAALILVGQVFHILGLFLSSKAVSRGETATMSSAIIVWSLHLALGVAVIVGIGFLTAIAAAQQSALQMAISVIGVLLLGLVLVFLIPMKVYMIGFWRAFALLLLAGAIQTLAMFGVQMAAVPYYFPPEQLAAFRDLQSKSPQEQQRVIEQFFKLQAPDEIDRIFASAQHPAGGRLSQAQREAAVNLLQQKLEERRRNLPPGDAQAAADFQAKLDRYLRLLAEVKAERTTAAPRVPGVR